MARRFLSGIDAEFVKNLEDPLLPLDAVNKQYVDFRIMPVGGLTGQVLAKSTNDDYDTEWINQSGGTPSGTNISINMGTFPEPVNASINAGSF